MTTLTNTAGTGTITYSPCYKCGSWQCLGGCQVPITSGSISTLSWPHVWPVIDYDLLASKVAEKLVDMMKPEKAREREKTETERRDLVMKFRKALEELEKS